MCSVWHKGFQTEAVKWLGLLVLEKCVRHCVDVLWNFHLDIWWMNLVTAHWIEICSNFVHVHVFHSLRATGCVWFATAEGIITHLSTGEYFQNAWVKWIATEENWIPISKNGRWLTLFCEKKNHRFIPEPSNKAGKPDGVVCAIANTDADVNSFIITHFIQHKAELLCHLMKRYGKLTMFVV